MVLPTFAIIDDAHMLRICWEKLFFGDPAGLKTVDEALLETWEIYPASNLAPARGFLNFVVRQSMTDLALEADTLAVKDLFYRVNELFIYFEVSVHKGGFCDDRDRTVRATCVEMYTNGDRMKPDPQRAAIWRRDP